MRALSLHQPYAHHVVMGNKTVENRTWRPPISVIGHRMLIHATLSTKDYCVPAEFEDDDQSKLVRGCIIGSVQVDGFVHPDMGIVGGAILQNGHAAGILDRVKNDDWFVGPIAWVLSSPRVYETPIAAKGSQRVWFVSDPETIAAVNVAEMQAAESQG